MSHVALFSCVEGWHSSLCCGAVLWRYIGFWSTLGDPIISGACASTNFTCRRLVFISLLWSFGVWRYTWFWPNSLWNPILGGAGCSTNLLRRRLASVLLLWRDKGSQSTLWVSILVGACDCVIFSLVEFCVVEVWRVLNYFFFGSVFTVLVELSISNVEAFWYFGFLSGPQQVHFLLL